MMKFCEYLQEGKCNVTGVTINCPYTFYDIKPSYETQFNRGGYYLMNFSVSMNGCNGFKATSELETMLKTEVKKQLNTTNKFNLKFIKL
jgi:hypothetical protein